LASNWKGNKEDGKQQSLSSIELYKADTMPEEEYFPVHIKIWCSQV
jgi:hypothetical protein